MESLPNTPIANDGSLPIEITEIKSGPNMPLGQRLFVSHNPTPTYYTNMSVPACNVNPEERRMVITRTCNVINGKKMIYDIETDTLKPCLDCSQHGLLEYTLYHNGFVRSIKVIKPPPQIGEIQLVLGPMFSGKSTELLRRIRRYTVAKKKCIVIKYSKDTRYSTDNLATHDNIQFVAIPAEKLEEVFDEILNYEVIAIDEGQFFSDIFEVSDKLANQFGKIVIVAALDGTFKREPFPAISQLLSMADNYEKKTAICMFCHNKNASFTVRLTDETETEAIGGADKYASACRECYNEFNKNKNPAV